MRKLAAAVLAVILSCVFTGGSIIMATPVAFLQAKPISVKYSRDGVYEIIRINAEGYTDYDSMELKAPLRLVIDLKNTKAPKTI